MKQISIISGKGGTGKTSIAASFAALANNAVFADCDVEAADLHLIFKPVVEEAFEYNSLKKVHIIQDECIRCGLCFNLCRFDAIDRIRNKYYVRTFSCEACDLCRKACPVSAIEPIDKKTGDYFISSSRFGPLVYGQLVVGAEISGELISHIKDLASEIGNENNADFLIIDGPPGIGINAIASITGSDFALLIAEPTQSGIHDLKRSIKLAATYDISVKVIINKWDLNIEIANQIEKYCMSGNIEILSKIPFDINVSHAMFQQKSVVELDETSIASESIIDAWKQLLSSI